MRKNRLKSMSHGLSWCHNNWSTEITLHDGVKDSVIDWSSTKPGVMTLSTSDSNVDLGFGELISSMLEYRESELLLPESSGSLFLKSMELIEIVEPPNLGTGKMCWTVNESNMYSLISNTQSYLNPILSDANGDWNLSKPLSSGNWLVGVRYFCTPMDMWS